MSKLMIKKDTQDNQDIETVVKPSPNSLGNVSGEQSEYWDIVPIEGGYLANKVGMLKLRKYFKSVKGKESPLGSLYGVNVYLGTDQELKKAREALSNGNAPDRQESPDAK